MYAYEMEICCYNSLKYSIAIQFHIYQWTTYLIIDLTLNPMFEFVSFDLGYNCYPPICMRLLPYHIMPSSTQSFTTFFWICTHYIDRNPI
jgi:hypothetical protein